MQSSDLQALWIIAALSVVAVIVAVVQVKRSKKVREQLEMLAREVGWSEVRSSTFPEVSVRGIWNGYSVRVRLLRKGKSTPERIETNIRIQAPSRVAVTRRGVGILANKPLPFFGTPLVDLPLYSQFWICAGEITLAERLMQISAAALERLLLSEYDFLRMGGNKLTVRSSNMFDDIGRIAREEMEQLRANPSLLPDSADVLRMADKRLEELSKGPDDLARLAREQLELVRAVIDALALRP